MADSIPTTGPAGVDRNKQPIWHHNQLRPRTGGGQRVRDIRECTVAIFSDNTPAVIWGTKASATTTGPAAYLLRTTSLHQRRHRYLLQHAYILGPANVLTNIASRRFDLSDDPLLHRLTTLSPHAQNWRMLMTSPELVSQLTCNLLRTSPDRPYLHNAPAPSISFGPTTGCRTRNPWVWTPSYPLWQTKSPTSKSSRTASDRAPPATVVSWSGLHAYVTKSSPLRRVSPTWVSPTRTSCLLDSWTPAHTVVFHLLTRRPSTTSSKTPTDPNHPPCHRYRQCQPHDQTHRCHGDDLDRLLLLVAPWRILPCFGQPPLVPGQCHLHHRAP